MKVLIGCESSTVVRTAFERRGHDAWSCDLLDAPGKHIKGDVFWALKSQRWDLFIVHPPCTYLSVSGMHWTTRGLRDPQLTEQALYFVRTLMAIAPQFTKRWALENPVGIISTRVRPLDQSIQPYDFGEDASKRTCLWLYNLPKLRPTRHVPGRLVEWPKGSGKMVERWANQTDSGQNRLPPSEDRWQQRSETYPGIADAFADQWGCLP